MLKTFSKRIYFNQDFLQCNSRIIYKLDLIFPLISIKKCIYKITATFIKNKLATFVTKYSKLVTLFIKAANQVEKVVH